MFIVTANSFIGEDEFTTEVVGVFDTEIQAELVEQDLINNSNYDEVSIAPIKMNTRYI